MYQGKLKVRKESLIESCKQTLGKQRQQLVLAMDSIDESMATETKSSLGDKHETARARMQFEQEKLRHQVEELSQQLVLLDKIDTHVLHTSVGFGSLVSTEKGLFFIATAIGKLVLENETIYVISAKSPLAMAIKGLQKGESVVFQNQQQTILELN